MVINETLPLSTHGNTDVIDITERVSLLLENHSMRNGIVTLFVSGSTGALTTIEFEKGVINDLKEIMNELVPTERRYQHDLAWGDGNGHSHIRAALLGPSLTVPVIDGKLALGTWQQIVFIDCDNRPRQRELIIQLSGE